ncbi:MAG: hypothetical protein ACK5PW_09300 [Burkholderiales bacterium]
MRPTRPGAWLTAAVPLLAAVLASVAWCLHAGPSWSWDRGHYHEYAGHAWLSDLAGQGLLPGGGQGLLNPLGYVPQAMLAAAGWSPAWVAAATAAFQAAAVWMVWLIARDRSPRTDLHLPAALLAFLTPLYLSQLGSSYIDVSSGVGVLLGVWACRRGADPRRGALAFVALGGLAMGAATGLKLSNAVPAALAAILFAGAMHGRGLRAAATGLLLSPLVYGVSAIAGMAFTYGGWGAMLFRRHGNPFFPAFEHLFNPVAIAAPVPAAAAAAADAAAGGGGWAQVLVERLAGLVRLSGGRFVPQSFEEALSLPWRIADPSLPANQAYVEWHAPDPRLAVLLVLLACVGAGLLLRVARTPASGPAPGAAARMDPRLTGFVLAWLAAWTFTSSNGRYGIVLLMLASVPIVQAVHVLRVPDRARHAALLALLALQAVFALALQERGDQTSGSGWRDAALQADVPAALRDRPTLHVVPTNFSWSYLLPRLHPRSTLLNLSAMCRGDRCHPEVGIARARALLDSWQGSVRVLLAATVLDGGAGGIDAGTRAAFDMQLAELDLRIAPGRCESIAVRPMFGDTWMVETVASGFEHTPSRFGVSCPLEPAPGAAAVARVERDRHAAVFAALATACPRELGGAAGPIEWIDAGRWRQLYPMRDIRIDIRGEQVSATRLQRSRRVLGTVGDLRAGWSPLRCAELVWPGDDRAALRADSNP